MTAWLRDWSGQTCAIVGSGPSVNQSDVDELKGRCKVIVINNSYRLAPWADCLYAADDKWWRQNPQALDFAGLKLTSHAYENPPKSVLRVKLVDQKSPHRMNLIQNNDLFEVGAGGHGGFQASNIALYNRVARILWLGIDMVEGHWHSEHQFPLRNPRPSSLERRRAILDDNAERFAMAGVEVINCSKISTLSAYPKMSVREALAQ
jgi:hypothetical protein